MSTAQANRRYTLNDLATMPNGERFELVDGRLVERDMSALSSWVALELGSLIRNHCKAHGLAWAFGPDCGYRCFPGETLRRPDVSVVRRDRLDVEQMSEGSLRVAPDLAVEVVSPNDLAYEVDQKVDEYLRAGVRLVWVVNPERRSVLSHRADGSVRLLREPDELSGEDVLPGFRCPVGELFPPLPAAK